MKKVVKFIRLLFAIILVIPPFALISIVAIIFGGFFRLIRLNKISDALRDLILDIDVWWIITFLGSRVRVLGKENLPKKGSKYCLFPNHESAIDIPAVYYSKRWPGMVAKKELYSIPIIHGLLWLLRCVKINRQSPREAIEAIKKGVENIENGEPMVIFPEGTRSKTGEIGSFKAGSFKMATRAKALVVPVVIKNTRALLENAYHFGIVPVYVEFLEPIETENMSEEELKDLPLLVENRVKEAYSVLPTWPKKKGKKGA